MNIETFSELIKKHAGVRAIKRYQTDVPDYRFGIPETYVAASFEKNTQSTVLEFRIGYLKGMIYQFNALPGVNAVPHTTSNDMLVVTIGNNAFTDDTNALIDVCARRAINKFFQKY